MLIFGSYEIFVQVFKGRYGLSQIEERRGRIKVNIFINLLQLIIDYLVYITPWVLKGFILVAILYVSYKAFIWLWFQFLDNAESKLPGVLAYKWKTKEGMILAVLKLLFYGFVFLMFLVNVAMGLIPLPVAAGIIVVMTNLLYLSIDRSSPIKKRFGL